MNDKENIDPLSKSDNEEMNKSIWASFDKKLPLSDQEDQPNHKV